MPLHRLFLGLSFVVSWSEADTLSELLIQFRKVNIQPFRWHKIGVASVTVYRGLYDIVRRYTLFYVFRLWISSFTIERNT